MLTTLEPQTWLWIGGWLGSATGLLLAGFLTGFVLLWLLQGPRRGMQGYALHTSNIFSWRTIPQWAQQGTLRWARGLLLLVMLALLIEAILYRVW